MQHAPAHAGSALARALWPARSAHQPRAGPARHQRGAPVRTAHTIYIALARRARHYARARVRGTVRASARALARTASALRADAQTHICVCVFYLLAMTGHSPAVRVAQPLPCHCPAADDDDDALLVSLYSIMLAVVVLA